ncbi:MAG: hypothetical protein LBG23_03225, partial [Endomicrobium sp.]|nr:hypothetical protein [Endomicrobium sp.]
DYKFIEVIEKTNMYGRHLLVTNEHLSDIKDFDKKIDFIKTLRFSCDYVAIFIHSLLCANSLGTTGNRKKNHC